VSVARVVVCALLALPAGWLAGLLADRVPHRLPILAAPLGPRLDGRHLLVHAGVLVLYAAAGARLGDQPPSALVGFLVLFATLVAVSVIDVEHYRLPDAVVLPAIALSVALLGAATIGTGDVGPLQRASVGAAMYFGLLLVAHLASPRGMGFGDVKLGALMGAYLGWLAPSYAGVVSLVLWAMLAGFVAGSIGALAFLAVRRRSEPIPFGPFLALGTVVVVLSGPGTLPT
jgi:leader peptidase (prepilin peptidase)/N-methyltransferase